jgi:hypothetical protein
MEIYTFLWGMSNVDYRNVEEEEEVGKQCARRPSDGWPSRPFAEDTTVTTTVYEAEIFFVTEREMEYSS